MIFFRNLKKLLKLNFFVDSFKLITCYFIIIFNFKKCVILKLNRKNINSIFINLLDITSKKYIFTEEHFYLFIYFFSKSCMKYKK